MIEEVPKEFSQTNYPVYCATFDNIKDYLQPNKACYIYLIRRASTTLFPDYFWDGEKLWNYHPII